MAIELIAKIKPKNNGDFRLVDAEDIDYNGQSLKDLLDTGLLQEDEVRAAVAKYLRDNPVTFEQGSGIKIEGNTISVDAADAVEPDNTKPITSAAVATQIGNIDALLKII